MIIRAKYATYCPHCATVISVGDKVIWTRGLPARHPNCDYTQAENAVLRISTGNAEKQLLWAKIADIKNR